MTTTTTRSLLPSPRRAGACTCRHGARVHEGGKGACGHLSGSTFCPCQRFEGKGPRVVKRGSAATDTAWYWDGGTEVGRWRAADASEHAGDLRATCASIRRAGRVCRLGLRSRPPSGAPTLTEFRAVGHLPRHAGELPPGAVRCGKECSKCREPFSPGDAVVVRGKKHLCMPCAMKSGSSKGRVLGYLGQGHCAP
jgi:hypothetical protein